MTTKQWTTLGGVFSATKKSHFKSMGDLFGPYWVPSHCFNSSKDLTGGSSNGPTANSTTVDKKPKSKRKSQATENQPFGSVITAECGNSTVEKDGEGEVEIWFHGDGTASPGCQASISSAQG